MSVADRETRRDMPARAVPHAGALLPALATLAGLALLLYAYRALPERPFAADDYQWLLSVRGLSLSQVVRAAFDAGSQSHFYRPLVWLLFWIQSQLFGLEPRGYHLVSLALHALDAALLALLAWRLGAGRWGALLAMLIVLLHPAPFEAIVWISAQSELLAAGLLLAALHLWRGTSRFAPLLAAIALGLALLAKESAVIGLPLLALLGRSSTDDQLVQLRRSTATDLPRRHEETKLNFSLVQAFVPSRLRGDKSLGFLRQAVLDSSVARISNYVLPGLITTAYAALQIGVERRNYLLRGGGYGLGPQLITNPLRSVALIVVPLPGSEHADAAWLVPLGAVVALGLLALLVRGPWGARRFVLALLLVLLPTAPFASPPDSRYLYLPVLAAALLLALAPSRLRGEKPLVQFSRGTPTVLPRRYEDTKSNFSLAQALAPWRLRGEKLMVVLHKAVLIMVGCSLLAVLLAWAAVGEIAAREGHFAAASGPGGSLWYTTTQVCRDERPKRMIVVDPPLAAPHAEAIVQLACGPSVRPVIVGRDQLAKALKRGSVVIGFNAGSAQVEQRI